MKWAFFAAVMAVYPRPRGGTSAGRRTCAGTGGLSPPTRGNRRAARELADKVGSIPAHAGEPIAASVNAGGRGVYPRPRGGTQQNSPRTTGTRGLSPPTRGNLRRVAVIERDEGSIPAHAGEPPLPGRAPPSARVYPRPRGGTKCRFAGARSSTGLSPPTRGNLARARGFTAMRRSIPAHAGEPGARYTVDASHWVYPRPRGGTVPPFVPPCPGGGLSPPTRGNLSCTHANFPLDGSIPAHAGEPRAQPASRTPSPVYPRPRGGTRLGRGSLILRWGLSPPTRGNPCAVVFQRLGVGSIPAHAGEPFCTPPSISRSSVYPRPRGGTPNERQARASASGLSPPTRGNPFHLSVVNLSCRSIPAHAGEPTFGLTIVHTKPVYPRPRGGTIPHCQISSRYDGLSPPTRGNRCPPHPARSPGRSIPAHAGEPAAGHGASGPR